MFKRKAFDKLKYWKKNKAPNYAVLLEGLDVLEKQQLQRNLQNKNIDLTSKLTLLTFEKMYWMHLMI